MPVRTTVVGSYPKPPNEGETFTVRKTIQALDRGDATVDDLHRAQDDLVSQLIAEQEAAGIDIVTDGHARWDDILTPFARAWEGFEIGGLLRWFDNNVYYRKPVCIGDIAWSPASIPAFEFARSTAKHTVKAVIPGPVTFAKLSVNEHYDTHERFVSALADVLAQEAQALQAAGAEVIQIDEPALLDAPEDLQVARDALGRITAGLDSTHTVLATYFGDAKRLGAELFELPVDRFGLDLISGPENEVLLDDVPDTVSIQAGVVDARNTRLEDEDGLSKRIGGLTERFDGDRLWVAPSAGLEFLPREKARAKLETLARVAGRL